MTPRRTNSARHTPARRASSSFGRSVARQSQLQEKAKLGKVRRNSSAHAASSPSLGQKKEDDPTSEETPELCVSFVPGIIPGKWFERFQERYPNHRLRAVMHPNPLALAYSGECDMAFVRLPLGGREALADVFHVVELYEEQPGVAAAKDNALSVFEEVSLADLEGETILYQPDSDGLVDVAAVREYLEVAQADLGVVIAPRPLLRHYNVRDVKDSALRDGVATLMALIWRKDRDSELLQSFVGVVKGRTQRSSR